jgi:hypothetical protein
VKKATLFAAAVATLFCAGSLLAPAADAKTKSKGHHHAKMAKQSVDPNATAALSGDGMMWHDPAGPKTQHGMCWGSGSGKHGEGFWKACK